MLTIEGADLFGLGAAPSLLTVFEDLLRSRGHGAFNGHGLGGHGLGAVTEWDAFLANKGSTYQDADKIVYCKWDSKGRPECFLQAYPAGAAARSGPIADMQRAADALLNLIPVYHLDGLELTASVPTAAGGTQTATFTAPTLPQNPILVAGGAYDGVVGSGTMKYAGPALILAGMLKSVPDDVVLAYVAPMENTFAMHAAAIARFLNAVVADFAALLAAYKARGSRPATSPLEPETVLQIIDRRKKHAWVKPVALTTVAAGFLGLSLLAFTHRQKKDEAIEPAFPMPQF